ncbi:putative arabinan endo-1,5-alpha-L-arabinosidase C [Cytospora mali]|uniref:Arabinan endo-1,5-alpha-L-arabinosidase C n=1 Tax=Cytospora mali TaxID=578113 RepID=A0A194VLP1_CYTMA|nr:putative arabinan endo-1,5-alpha-L-arabinosidase C [Valsa mali]
MRLYGRMATLGLLASLSQSVTSSSVLPGGRFHSKRKLTAAFNGALYDFPDPSIEQAWSSDGGKWYAFATTGNGYQIQVAVADSPDGPWTALGHDALPDSGSWTTGVDNWAPDVKRMPPENQHLYIMTYSGALASDTSHHCVGIATSSKIEGPYTPHNSPVICPDIASTGGAIDSSSFYDQVNNKRYIVYKEDGNSVGNGGDCNNGIAPIHSTPIMLQEMNVNDWTTPVGSPVEILDRTDNDGPLIEAPNIIGTADGYYILFYSSHCFTDPKYDVKYATSKSITGPYERKGELLATGDYGLNSPGGATATPQGNVLLFHANCSDPNTGAETRDQKSMQ